MTLRVAAAVFLLLFQTRMVSAQTFRPAVQSVSPIGFQRGREVEWTLSGTWIGTAKSLIMDIPGVRVVGLSAPPVPDGARNPEGVLKVRLSIAPDAIPGRYPVRVATAAGISDPAFLVIGVWPEILDKEPNTATAPQSVAIPCTVVGALDSPEDVDVFSIEVKSGEKIVVDVATGTLGSPSVPVVVVKDPTGKEAASSMALRTPDASLVFHANAQGTYRIFIRDLSFRGGAEYRYRATVGAIPRITSVFPPGGTAGKQVTLRVRGFNLPEGFTSSQYIPMGLADDTVEMVLPTPLGFANPVKLGRSDADETVEVEPNNSRSTAHPIPFPTVVNGRLEGSLRRTEDEDWFAVRLTAGTPVHFEVDAARLGSPLDPVLSVHDASGNRLASADDGVGSDPSLVWTPSATATYMVRVADLHSRSGGNCTYRLKVLPALADFRLTFTPDAPLVPLGGRVPVLVGVERKNGFSGSIALEWSQLPAGLRSAGEMVIPAGRNQALLTLETDAQGFAPGILILEGVAIDGGRPLRRKALGLRETASKNGEQIVIATAPVPMPAVAPAGFPDLLVEVDQRMFSVAPGASVELPVRLRRSPGFAIKVPLVVRGLPAGVTAEVVQVAESANDGKLVVKVEGNVAIGDHQIAVVARSVRDELRWNEHASPPLVLRIAR